MNKKYQKIIEYIHDENRDEAVILTLELLENGDIDIVTLYEKVLAYALNTINCDLEPEECIWKEHIKSAIVRSIIEVSYPYIIKGKNEVEKNGKRILIVCPSEEYHEIGAKMAHDFFLLSGYDSIFVGANTPLEEILNAIKFLKVDCIAISVTNYYNIVTARKIIDRIKSEYPSVQIYIGGNAFASKEARNQITYDKHLTTFKSIRELAK